MVILKSNEKSLISYLIVSCELAFVAASPSTSSVTTLQFHSNVPELCAYFIG